MNLMMTVPDNGAAPLLDFLDSLDPKVRVKLGSLFFMLMTTPPGLLREPYVKHFTIERYSSLYELRAKGNVMVRIIFTVRPDGNILFLTPFVKRHKRNTMQALDASLKQLSQIEDGICSVQELAINHITGG